MAMAAMASASSSSSVTGPGAACAGDGGHQDLYRVKLMCSYGGRILPRPHDNNLRYVGGESRIVVVSRSIDFSDLFSKLSGVFGSPVLIKYQLPSEDLDALISVTCEEDLQNMMEEYDKLQQICAGNRSSSSSSSSSSRLRVFLFPLKLVDHQHHYHQSSRSHASRQSFVTPQYIHTNSSSNPIHNPNHLHPPWPALDADLKSGMHLQRSASETRKVPDFGHGHDSASSETVSYSHGLGKVSSETSSFAHHGHCNVLSETAQDYNSHGHGKVPLQTQEYLSQSHVNVASIPSNTRECSHAPLENQDHVHSHGASNTVSSSQQNTDFNLFGSLLQHYSAGSGAPFSNLKSADADMHKMNNASSGLKTSPSSGGLSDAESQKDPSSVLPQASSEDIIGDLSLSNQMKPAHNLKDGRPDIDIINQVKLSSGQSGGVSNVQVKPHAPGHKVWPEVALDLNLDTIHINGNLSPQKSGTRSPNSTDKRVEGNATQMYGDVNSFSRTSKISTGAGDQLQDGDKNPNKAFAQSEEMHCVFNNGLHEDASQMQPAFIGDPIFDEEDPSILELPQNLLMLDLEDQPLPSVTSPSSDLLTEPGADNIFSISSVQSAGVKKAQKEENHSQNVSIELTQDLLLKLDIEKQPHINPLPDFCNVSSTVMPTIPPPLIASSQPFIHSSPHLAAVSRPSPVPVVLPHALPQSKVTVSSPSLIPIDIKTVQQPPIAVIDVNVAHQKTYEQSDMAHFWRQSSDPPYNQLQDIIGQQNSSMWHHQPHIPVENPNVTRFIPFATPISEGVTSQPMSMLGGVSNKKALEQLSTAQYILPTIHDASNDFLVGGIKAPIDGYMPGTANPFMDHIPHQDLFQQPVPRRS